MSDRVLKQALNKAVTGQPVQATACIDDNTVAAYLDSTLEPAQMTAVEEHASVCSSCRELIGLALSIGASGRSREKSREPESRRWRGWLLHPATAAAAIAILAVGGAVVLVRLGTQETRRGDQVAAVQTPAAPKPEDAPRVRQAEDSRVEPKTDTAKGRSAANPIPPLETNPHARTPPAEAVSQFAAESKAKSVAEGELAVTAPGAAGMVGGVAAPAESAASGKEEGAGGRFEMRPSRQIELQQPAAMNSADESRISAAAPAPRGAADKLAVTSAGPAEAIRTLRETERTRQETRNVGQLRFYRVGVYWIDGRCLKTDVTDIVELKADSPELPSVLADLPDLSALVLPGVRVLTVFDGKVFLLPGP